MSFSKSEMSRCDSLGVTTPSRSQKAKCCEIVGSLIFVWNVSPLSSQYATDPAYLMNKYGTEGISCVRKQGTSEEQVQGCLFGCIQNKSKNPSLVGGQTWTRNDTQRRPLRYCAALR